MVEISFLCAIMGKFFLLHSEFLGFSMVAVGEALTIRESVIYVGLDLNLLPILVSARSLMH